MSVTHIINHADLGELEIVDPVCVRVDTEGENEHYVVVVHSGYEVQALCLEEDKDFAKGLAKAYAKQFNCKVVS
jgi:hypothetical protein